MHLKLSVYKHVSKLLFYSAGGGAWKLTEDRECAGSHRARFWWFAWLCLTCVQLLSSGSFCCCLFLHYADRETMMGTACQISTRGAEAEVGAEPGLTLRSEFTLGSPWSPTGQAGRKAASPMSDLHLVKAAKTAHWFQQSVQQAKLCPHFATQLLFSSLYSPW